MKNIRPHEHSAGWYWTPWTYRFGHGGWVLLSLPWLCRFWRGV